MQRWETSQSNIDADDWTPPESRTASCPDGAAETVADMTAAEAAGDNTSSNASGGASNRRSSSAPSRGGGGLYGPASGGGRAGCSGGGRRRLTFDDHREYDVLQPVRESAGPSEMADALSWVGIIHRCYIFYVVADWLLLSSGRHLALTHRSIIVS